MGLPKGFFLVDSTFHLVMTETVSWWLGEECLVSFDFLFANICFHFSWCTFRSGITGHMVTLCLEFLFLSDCTMLES